MRARQSQLGLKAIVEGDRVRRAEREGVTVFAAPDVVAAALDPAGPPIRWEDIKRADPAWAVRSQAVAFAGAEGAVEQVDALDLPGVLQLLQAMPAPHATRLKEAIARAAADHLAEADDPELAILRTRRLYERRGRSRRWIDGRLGGVSGRQALTGEWHRRGASESDQFRALTNILMRASFGMEVEAYRRHKGLTHTRENLRDHMGDMELSLVALAETVAVELHRERGSQGFDALAADAEDAGEVVAGTRMRIAGVLGEAIA